MNDLSPVTGKSDYSVIEKIKVDQIQSLYLPFDVSHYFKDLDEIELRKCPDSGYMFYWPLSLEGRADVYGYLQKREGYYKKDRYEFKKALQYINNGDEILEIGSGDGNFIDYISKKKNVNAKGIEINEEAVKVARSRDLDVIKCNLEDLDSTSVFDAIICFQVLEHISDVKNFVNSLLIHLKPEGRLIISVPNNGGFMFTTKNINIYNLPPHHMGLWTSESMNRVTKFFDIELVKVHYEHLQKENYPLYNIHLKRKLSRYHSVLAVLWRQIPEKIKLFFISFFSVMIHGHTMMAVYQKSVK